MQKFKINVLFNRLSGVILALALTASGCTSDQLPKPSETDCTGFTPTFSQDIQPIIDASCAFSGCHLDTAPGVYDSYEGLLPVLEDGKFRQRVITERSDGIKGMPPDFAPDNRPKDLTEEQIQLIDCWLLAGHPE